MTDNHVPPASPSEFVLGFMRRLHPMTRFVVTVAVLHFTAEAFIVWGQFGRIENYGERPLDKLLVAGEALRNLIYPVLDLGTAATIEFLFRIWEELKVRKRRVADAD